MATMPKHVGAKYVSRRMLYWSVCPLVVYSHTIYNEAVNPLTPRKYTVLNGNFVFDLCDIFRNSTLA